MLRGSIPALATAFCDETFDEYGFLYLSQFQGGQMKSWPFFLRHSDESAMLAVKGVRGGKRNKCRAVRNSSNRRGKRRERRGGYRRAENHRYFAEIHIPLTRAGLA